MQEVSDFEKLKTLALRISRGSLLVHEVSGRRKFSGCLVVDTDCVYNYKYDGNVKTKGYNP